MNKVNNHTSINYQVDHKQEKYKNVPKDYMKVANGIEAQFTNHLLGQMRKTIPKQNPESQAERIYNSMLDSERAQLMANSTTGLGIKDLVLDQIYPQYKKSHPQKAINQYQKMDANKGVSHE